MNKKFLASMILPLLAWGCAALEPIEVREQIYGKAAPVISQSFASKQMRPGDTWKVYLLASSPEGQMKNIVCTIEQPGVGTYPVSLLKIKAGEQKQLSGYIYLNTVGVRNLNFVNLTLTVQIQDQAGHYSQPAVFPLAFNIRFQQEPPPPGVYPEKDLGPIMIDLSSIGDEDRPSIFRRRIFP